VNENGLGTKLLVGALLYELCSFGLMASGCTTMVCSVAGLGLPTA